MLNKSNKKKVAGKRHATNFGAGYIKIEEYHLLRTGLRGRKKWAFICGAVFLTLVAIGNLILNIFLLAVLGLRPTGLPYMILASSSKVIFPQPLDVSRTEVMGGISSYWNTSLVISAQSPSMIISAGPMRTQVQPLSSTTRVINSSQISLTRNSIQLQPFQSFSLHDVRNHEEVISIDQSRTAFNPQNDGMTLLNNLKSTSSPVYVNNVDSNTITGDRLRLVSYKTVTLQSTGEDSSVNLESNENIIITLGDQNSHFISDSQDGILMNGLPSHQSTNGYHGDIVTNYHLCICGRNGKIFRVSETCSRANELIDPCS